MDQAPGQRGWDKFPPLHYVSEHCEPYLKKYYPRWRRSHVSRDATYSYLRKRTTGRKATPADMADFASEGELVGRYILDVYREFMSWALERGISPSSKYGAISAFFRSLGSVAMRYRTGLSTLNLFAATNKPFGAQSLLSGASSKVRINHGDALCVRHAHRCSR